MQGEGEYISGLGSWMERKEEKGESQLSASVPYILLPDPSKCEQAALRSYDHVHLTMLDGKLRL